MFFIHLQWTAENLLFPLEWNQILFHQIVFQFSNFKLAPVVIANYGITLHCTKYHSIQLIANQREQVVKQYIPLHSLSPTGTSFSSLSLHKSKNKNLVFICQLQLVIIGIVYESPSFYVPLRKSLFIILVINILNIFFSRKYWFFY